MDTHELIIQDLSDLLRINQERVIGYNKSAYACENFHLKMLLNRELDQARDAVFSLKQLLKEKFNIESLEASGQLFLMWSDFKPSFDECGTETQLQAFEMADLLTLKCYRLAIARSYVDAMSKNLLEFQYQKSMSIYANIKAYRQAYRNNLNRAMHYQPRRIA